MTAELPIVELVPLRDVSLAHALCEGEGYASVDEWRAGHVRFWSSAGMQEELGDDFTVEDSSVVVLERFEVVREEIAERTRRQT